MPLAVIFCNDPLDPRKAEPVFRREAEAAQAIGIARMLIDHDALDRHHDAAAAIKRIPADSACDAVYRGWMLRAEDYRAMHTALALKGVGLINSPQQYASCHHAPEAHPHIAPWTAHTVWLSADGMADDTALAEVLRNFGSGPAVLKGWVKSQASGYWHEACFIPDASDLAPARRIVNRFIELQDESLVGGLVFRAYVPLARAAGEWRAFVLDGQVLGCWPRGAVQCDGPPAELLSEVASRLPSRFATMDFALKESGGWLLIETGDGQVSELPPAADPLDILKPLAALFA